MKWYKCFIAGENFPGQLIGQHYLIGFYTTRFVQAANEEGAESAGLEFLRTEDSLRLPVGVKPLASAKVYFEEVAEVDETEVPDVQAGFTFFEMGS